MKVLIVGAGAVGQVYGRHLALGGAQVYYLVREKYADSCRQGFVFYPLNRRKPRKQAVREALAPDSVLTRMEEVRASKWNQVYLCLSSAGIRDHTIELLSECIGEATIVSLQPGPDDREYLAKRFDPDRLVTGMITLISYPAPLADERVPEPGMAYWFPPFSPAPFSGPGRETRQVVEALRRGGLPCRISRDVPRQVAFPSAILYCLLAALEAADWSFGRLFEGARLGQVRQAAREALAVVARGQSRRAPRMIPRLLLNATALRLLLWVARAVVPFEFETYFLTHFRKVRDQTWVNLRILVESAERSALPVPALAALARSGPARPRPRA